MLLTTTAIASPQAELLANGYVLLPLPHDLDLLRRQMDHVLLAINEAEKRHLELQMHGGARPEELTYLQSVIQANQRRIEQLITEITIKAYCKHGKTVTIRVEDCKALVFLRANP